MAQHPSYPLVQEIPWQAPEQIANLFAHEVGTIFLDSAALPPPYGRYSFIARDPFLILSGKGKNLRLGKKTVMGDPFQILKQQLKCFSLPRLPDLPPFQGGVAGFLSYDLAHHLEKIPYTKIENSLPDLALGFYDVVIGFDHLQQRAFIFSSGYPELITEKRFLRAQQRRDELLIKIQNIRPHTQQETAHSTLIQSNFTENGYQMAVQKVIDYILAGDIFQANIAQRFSAAMPTNMSAYQLYCRLREINPAPFAAFVNVGETVIASASPERFIQLNAHSVTTCPIKGTRKRGRTPEEDLNLKNELLSSAKDYAENTMIVDLLRNDLSKVCEDHSIQVEKLCGLESFASVHHLVSVVNGKLKEEYDAIDLLCATFPGGSITGAPKVRAMEIIAEIEPHARGPYCGSIGYIGFNGDMDSSIVIRSFVIHNNEISFHAGGGIVADSQPHKEYAETLTKAQALFNALK